jgi:hypothetical protein
MDTERVGNQYWERDGIIPEVTDHTANNLIPGNDSGSDCENSDSSSQNDSNNSEIDSQCDSSMPDQDSDMELA